MHYQIVIPIKLCALYVKYTSVCLRNTASSRDTNYSLVNFPSGIAVIRFQLISEMLRRDREAVDIDYRKKKVDEDKLTYLYNMFQN